MFGKKKELQRQVKQLERELEGARKRAEMFLKDNIERDQQIYRMREQMEGGRGNIEEIRGELRALEAKLTFKGTATVKGTKGDDEWPPARRVNAKLNRSRELAKDMDESGNAFSESLRKAGKALGEYDPQDPRNRPTEQWQSHPDNQPACGWQGCVRPKGHKGSCDWMKR